MCDRGRCVAYGCQNGSVRLYYPESGAIKLLGSHHDKIEALDIKLVVTPLHNIENVVVVSGSYDGNVKIWWNGGQVFHCEKQHFSNIQEVSYRHFVGTILGL